MKPVRGFYVTGNYSVMFQHIQRKMLTSDSQENTMKSIGAFLGEENSNDKTCCQ